MKKLQKNTLTDGMLLDVHASVRKPSTTGKLKNFRVITRDNNSFIVTNVKGLEKKGDLTSGFIPLASREVNGVAYILSYNSSTLQGEIGCFPSPDYSTGAITHVYRPLMNYSGDGDLDETKSSAFRSTRFNFSLSAIIDMQLQNDYDGSVNVIFTDGVNPVRIINSGFAVKPGSRYELIDRSGAKDTNRYTPQNFENVINLITRSTKLLKVDFVGSVSGGILPCGNTQYYFVYGTSDGNETEIIGQSFTVPVFNGEKVASASGGRLTGEKSSKMNRFTLSNLDESYAYIGVYVVHADGMNAAVKTAYRINERYNILGSTMEFVHTGYEDKVTVPISNLIGESVSIGTAETLEQSGGMLMLGNIKEKKYELDAIKKFCRLVKLGHKTIKLDLIGPEAGFTRIFDEQINQSSLKPGTDGYNGGYVNPRNVHDKLGYWGGEAYPFMARVFFPDGSASPLFPVSGIDNVNGNNLSTLDNASITQLDALDNTGGFSTDGKMLNNQGIYRFPNRGGILNPIFYKSESGEGLVSVNGITFKIPALNTDLGGGKTIRDYSIGIQFFRGERRPDAIAQGTLIDCQLVPLTRQDEGESQDLFFDTYLESNSKLVPAYNHILESIHRWPTKLTSTIFSGNRSRVRDTNKDQDTFVGGIWPLKYGVENRDPHQVFVSNKSPFAMISSDFMVNPIRFSGIASKDISINLMFKMIHSAKVKTARCGQSGGAGDHFSVLMPSSLMPSFSNKGVYAGKASWVGESLEAKNADGFSSQVYFQSVHPDGKAHLIRNTYNSYLGVRLDGTFRASDPSLSPGGYGDYASGLLDKDITASFVANIYEGSSQRSADAVRQVYQNTDVMRYFPISQRMYWDAAIPGADASNTLEMNLDSSRRITLFNGDCFINFALRKLYSNASFLEADSDDNENVRIGYTIGVINEGNENASFRSLETIDLVEGERKHPLNYATKNTAVGDAYGKGNQWREYWINESSGYNKGFSQVSGNVLAASLPRNMPYKQNHWTTRVWPSAQHVQNSFENGYRSFLGLNYKDYPTQYGQITKLISSNDVLYCVQEDGVGIIGVNERIQTGEGVSGPVYLQVTDVLAPKMRMVSESVGSKHRSSVSVTENGVCGVSRQFDIWEIEGDVMRKLSDMSIRSYLDDAFSGKSLEAMSHLTHNIVTTRNKKFGELLFTFYNKESGSFSNDRCFTVQYNEVTKKIHSFYGFVPMQYMRIGDDLYSFNVKSFSGGIWLHDTTNPVIPMCHFYGTQDDCNLSFTVNQDEGEKVFTNLIICGNQAKPSSITYRIPGALAVHTPASVKNNIMGSNAKYRGGHWEIVIPKITQVHDQDVEQKLSSGVYGSPSEVLVGSRVRGNYMVVDLAYSSPGDLIELKYFDTVYSLLR